MPASYFSNFPFVNYSLNQSPKVGEYQWVTDIFRRAAPIQAILKDKKLFYNYYIADEETPEMIADRQYGSVKYHWVVTMFNGITDPLIEWPRKYSAMVTYIVDKYGSVATALSTTHHYTMTKTKTSSAGDSSSETYVIDATKYATLSSVVPVVYTFAGGGTVTVTTTRGIVNCYDYEIDLNETRRSIILLKPTYLAQVVTELERLLAAPE